MPQGTSEGAPSSCFPDRNSRWYLYRKVAHFFRWWTNTCKATIWGSLSFFSRITPTSTSCTRLRKTRPRPDLLPSFPKVNILQKFKLACVAFLRMTGTGTSHPSTSVLAHSLCWHMAASARSISRLINISFGTHSAIMWMNDSAGSVSQRLGILH